MPPRASVQSWVLLVTLSLIWGTSFMANKIAVAEIPPATVVAGRLAMAALILVAAVPMAGLRMPGRSRLWAWFLAMALVGNTVPFFLITWGQETVDSGLAGILMAVMPLSTMVLAHFLVDGERMTRNRGAGFAVGFIGIIVLMGPGALRQLGGSSGELVRQLAILSGAVCYAVNTIIARRMPETDPLLTSAGTLALGTLMILPLSLIMDRPWEIHISAQAALAVGYLGIASTAAAIFIYYRIIADAGATFVSQMNYLIPVVAACVGVAVLGENLGGAAAFALGMILFGIALSRR